MKTSLIPALAVAALMGLLRVAPVMAQAPPNGQAAHPAAQTPNGQPVDDNSLMIDNGLWAGADVGPCCAKCGGGSGCPPDWYTLQGVRVISRSNTRKVPISFRAPERGTYAAVPDTSDPTLYHVVNKLVTTFPDPAGSGNILRTQTSPSEVLNTKQFGLGVAPGYDMTIGHYFCRDRNNNDHNVESSFWGLNSWSASKTVAGYMVPIYDETKSYSAEQATLINLGELIPTEGGGSQGSLRTSFPLVPTELPDATPANATISNAFNYGTQQFFTYRSAMNNFELNGRFTPRGEPDRLVLHSNGKWQRECRPGTYMSYLYGVRFMQIDETFNFHSQSEGDFGTAVGDYDIVAHNDLLGLQIGAEMTFRQCRWSWGIESKLGPYINFANQHSVITAETIGLPDSAVNWRRVANKHDASLIGEVGFNATYKFRPNLMGRASWDFTWISGLALAPEQLQFSANPVDRINASGTIFSQGVSLGLEWLW